MSASYGETSHQPIAPDEATGDIGSVLRADGPDEIDTSSAVAEAAATLARGSAMLVVKRGPNVGAKFVLNEPVMNAGRHPASDIFLDDITVSRRHAEFRSENGEFRVVDLGSLNGTYLNRGAVDSAVLTNGDVLQIGNFRLVFLTAQTG
ncbi:FHA domain-containing protein [Mycobacterium colombiense]|uniref:FHA domain-containing protein n=1 Tax=Mycobacterium colombiense TaxID=339268 RepID=UPI0007EC3CB4|nr:FHA domain-containing protein [Mycobacterium colombiense]OBJ43713.1 FHA domain-containing protein [Mycobacterium colombiense]OBK57896.1 FHA domain-containing protein [Mycobacterium colombiense]OMB93177.1 FHA domain-containing protein [Mycobacterium colombiense]OMC23862.1 FHA domain-containing protein [Mycobacterium colombiense]OMC25907.1 FHA domain-containing protein [Mycobacterium colombiense]